MKEINIEIPQGYEIDKHEKGSKRIKMSAKHAV